MHPKRSPRVAPAPTASYSTLVSPLKGKKGVLDGKKIYCLGDAPHMATLCNLLKEKGDGMEILQDLGRDARFSIEDVDRIARSIEGMTKKPDAVVMLCPGVDLTTSGLGLPAITHFVAELGQRGIKVIVHDKAETTAAIAGLKIGRAGGVFVGGFTGNFEALAKEMVSQFTPAKAVEK